MIPTLPAHLSAAEFHRAVLALSPRIAVFDCDGTLWGGDAGYGFMLWSIETGLVSRNAADWIDSRYRLYRTGDISELAICGEMVQLLHRPRGDGTPARRRHLLPHPHPSPHLSGDAASRCRSSVDRLRNLGRQLHQQLGHRRGRPRLRHSAAAHSLSSRRRGRRLHHQHPDRHSHRRGQGALASAGGPRATGCCLRQFHPRRRHARTGPRAIRRQPHTRLARNRRRTQLARLRSRRLAEGAR